MSGDGQRYVSTFPPAAVTLDGVDNVLRCYFAGGDADDRFEVVSWHDQGPELIDGDSAQGVMRGPGASVYRRTKRTVWHRGQLWTVWEHHGDWRSYNPIDTAP